MTVTNTEGLPADAGPVLLDLARAAIGEKLGRTATGGAASDDWLRQPGACFVTLRLAGDLRGCIGSLIAHRGLSDDVRSNARAAAFEDPRFHPLSMAEFDLVRIEVSVLSAPRPMPFTDRADALAQLRPGVDGVILTARGRRATFLPQVWDELPEPATFIGHLLRKAGLPGDYWGPDVRIERYAVTAYEEPR
ncbi:MAG: AmmeMemoRadiSam system protein A [Propionibacteriaceae bacterium]|jgi:AmmeMemoRadiSam system protein A|nr:AmmeMemoRadiSam system protein A [Propionibacteriaceae bacterium]